MLNFIFYVQFGFGIFWQNNIGAKGEHKMLMKLTQGVNSTIILEVAFPYRGVF
jgi:hypothetical protein